MVIIVNSKEGILRIIAVSLLSAAMLVYTAYQVLFLDLEESAFAEMPIPASNETVSSKADDTSQAQSTVQEDKKTESAESDNASKNQSQAVSAKEAVKGKIIEKHISPYTVGLSYNNVYIKNSTGLNIDIKSLLTKKLSFSIKKNNEPQVLIMHTHTTESFMTQERDYYTDKDLSRRNDEKLNMVNLGNIVTKKLNDAGIKTLHDKTTHDYPVYNGSYSRAAETICSYLKKYPSIKIVIDMHRDAIASGSEKTKVTAKINGKKAAQVMLVMGSQSGSVTNFPNWQENLKLAVRLQQTLEVMYPTLARPLSLTSNNYNESLSNGSMLLEMGTDANTVAEVEYSAELVGNALVSLLNTLK